MDKFLVRAPTTIRVALTKELLGESGIDCPNKGNAVNIRPKPNFQKVCLGT
jgi:hypothetical protein